MRQRSHDTDVQLLEIEVPGQAGAIPVVIDCSQVLEVVETTSFKELPNLTRPFMGLLTLRGAPIPVLDFEPIVGGLTTNGSTNERFVICQATIGTIALRVRGRIRMRTCAVDDLGPIPDALSRHANRMACSRLAREEDDRFVPVVDIDVMLDRLTNVLDGAPDHQMIADP